MGHDWREMDPVEAARQDRMDKRRRKLKEKIKDISLGQFTVSELDSIMRLFGLSHNGIITFEANEEYLALLKKRFTRINKKRRHIR